MDPSNRLPPLFEAHLELREPDLVFVPSLNPDQPDCFANVVEGLTTDIIKMASLFPRIAVSHEADNYEVLVTVHYMLFSVICNFVLFSYEICQ
jgi:hypothetical protein